MKIIAAALPALLAVCASPGSAQTLTHRYSFNGSATDSVGGANGTLIGGVSLQSDPNSVNGEADFPGGSSSVNPAYISLPTSTVSSLQNATIEIYTTSFDSTGGAFQALFSVADKYNNLTNYSILSPNRAGSGLGAGARINNVVETAITSPTPLPDGLENHVIDLVYSGFTRIGSVGTETIYFDGLQAAQGQTLFSFADVASGNGGISAVGIGGGSPFNDPTFLGGLNEFRIYNGALTADQINLNITAGPGVVAVNVAAPGTPKARRNKSFRLALRGKFAEPIRRLRGISQYTSFSPVFCGNYCGPHPQSPLPKLGEG
jgi:hypothetical protein